MDTKISQSHLKELLFDGQVIPAHPLALTPNRRLDEKHQRALTRYYLDAGAGGIAVGVHTTQFEIRDPKIGLFEPVLYLASEEMYNFENATNKKILKISGAIGQTKQAMSEAEMAKEFGYDAVLLSLAAFKDATNSELIQHCNTVSIVLPLIGFYLQPSAGGRILDYAFWRDFCEIKNVVAIKVAPFNRYYTLDVVRGLYDSGRYNEIALYTGNDDNIVLDLFSQYTFSDQGRDVHFGFCGGLLGHWAVWTKNVVKLFDEIKKQRYSGDIPAKFVQLNSQITDCNAAFFDVQNSFKGCIVGINEILRRQGLFEGNRTLNPNDRISVNQKKEIDRVYEIYPHLNDDDFVAENLINWLC